MLTGRQPFPVPYDKRTNAPLLTELYKMQRASVQLKPVKLRPDLPEAAQAAILRALAFDPQARHAQARDFGEELAEALTGERPHASSSAPTEIVTPGIDERTATLSTAVRVKPESAKVVISFAAQDLSRALQIAERAAEGRRRVLDGRSRARSYVGQPLRNRPGDQLKPFVARSERAYTSGMARLDKIHNAVKNALTKDGWKITHDPYIIEYEEITLQADLAAERAFAAERAGQKIVVEVKSFIGHSRTQDFKLALGQYNLYLGLLEITAPERKLYLAIDHHTYDKYFRQKAIEAIAQRFQLALLVVNVKMEEIVAWIR